MILTFFNNILLLQLGIISFFLYISLELSFSCLLHCMALFLDLTSPFLFLKFVFVLKKEGINDKTF